MLITTTTLIEGRPVQQYLGIVTGEVIAGNGAKGAQRGEGDEGEGVAAHGASVNQHRSGRSTSRCRAVAF